jgi:hypothetical protein
MDHLSCGGTTLVQCLPARNLFIGLGLIGGYPLAILLLGRAWLLLSLFILTIAVMGTLMSRTMRNHCMNFACPFNRAEINLREAFFNLDPIINDAWKGVH